MATTKPDPETTKPDDKPAPKKGDTGTPTDDRSKRFVGGPEDVKVSKGTVTL